MKVILHFAGCNRYSNSVIKRDKYPEPSLEPLQALPLSLLLGLGTGIHELGNTYAYI